MERQKHQQTLQQELEGMEIEPVSSTWEYYTQQKEEVSFIYWCNIYRSLCVQCSPILETFVYHYLIYELLTIDLNRNSKAGRPNTYTHYLHT